MKRRGFLKSLIGAIAITPVAAKALSNLPTKQGSERFSIELRKEVCDYQFEYLLVVIVKDKKTSTLFRKEYPIPGNKFREDAINVMFVKECMLRDVKENIPEINQIYILRKLILLQKQIKE